MKKDELEVVYIEYHNGIPHSVTCSNNDYCRHYDFEKDPNDEDGLMYYNSGGGGSIKELQAPQYIDDYNGASYWMHESASFKGVPVNIKKLDTPIELFKGIINPFDEDISHEVFGMDYCKFCDKWYDENSCDEHHVWDVETGELKYFDGTKVE